MVEDHVPSGPQTRSIGLYRNPLWVHNSFRLITRKCLNSYKSTIGIYSIALFIFGSYLFEWKYVLGNIPIINYRYKHPDKW